MKSRTSFYNATALKKDVTRFAPVWCLYMVVLVIMAISAHNPNKVLIASHVLQVTDSMAVVNLIYGGLCANILFGDLFQSRMCNALHTMPLRREGWFLTHVIAGLLFCVLPNLLGCLLFVIQLQQYWYIALIWLAVAVLEFLFFFGLAVFSAMCAGNRLGMAAVYLVINFISILIYALAKQIYEPLLYGIEFTSDPYNFCCPVYHLSTESFVQFSYNFDNGEFSGGWIQQFYPQVWVYTAVIGALGLALLTLAALLYRRRHLERAGDFLALKVLEPVFLVICTLGCGMFAYALTSLFGLQGGYALMAVGVVVGFFAAQMLIKRTVRVFGVKNLVSFGALALALVVSLLLTKADVTGVTRYVPEEESIAAIRVYRDSERYVYMEGDYNYYQLEKPEEIAAFRQVHTQLMEERYEKTDGTSRMYIHYFLKDGSQVVRYYIIDEKTQAYDTLKAYFSHWRYLFNAWDWKTVEENITSVDVSLPYYEEGDLSEKVQTINNKTVTDPRLIAQFLEAVRKDSEAGNLAQAATFHVGQKNIGWFYLGSNVRDENGIIRRNGEMFRDLTAYSEATHIRALLEQWGKEGVNVASDTPAAEGK